MYVNVHVHVHTCSYHLKLHKNNLLFFIFFNVQFKLLILCCVFVPVFRIYLYLKSECWNCNSAIPARIQFGVTSYWFVRYLYAIGIPVTGHSGCILAHILAHIFSAYFQRY